MKHSKGKVDRGLHYCRCGCGYENAADLAQHIAVWDEAAESALKQREVAAKVKRLSPKLNFERDNKRRH
jgi:hypothetical protein